MRVPFLRITTLLGLLASLMYAQDFGAFYVGYTRASLGNMDGFKQKNKREALYFALKRGWRIDDSNILTYFLFDGSAGANHKNGLYSISGNIGLGYRSLGRLIPSVSMGYEEMSAPTPPNTDKQWNIKGVVADVSVFYGITPSIGLEIGYRMGFNQKGTWDRPMRFKSDRLMFSIGYYDFNL